MWMTTCTCSWASLQWSWRRRTSNWYPRKLSGQYHRAEWWLRMRASRRVPNALPFSYPGPTRPYGQRASSGCIGNGTRVFSDFSARVILKFCALLIHHTLTTDLTHTYTWWKQLRAVLHGVAGVRTFLICRNHALFYRTWDKIIGTCVFRR